MFNPISTLAYQIAEELITECHDAKHVTKEAFRKIILMKHKELLDRQTIDLRELICAVKEILYKYDNIRIIQDEPHNPDEEAPDTEMYGDYREEECNCPECENQCDSYDGDFADVDLEAVPSDGIMPDDLDKLLVELVASKKIEKKRKK